MKPDNKIIHFLPVNKIYPYKRNPRINDDAVIKLAELIQAFGFTDPIHLDEKNIILCGHTRWKSAVRLEMKEVPCIYILGLSEPEKKAYRIAHNKADEWAQWDFPMLKDEIESIDTGEIDLKLTGFDDNELEDLFTKYGDEYQSALEELYSKKIKAPIYEPKNKKPDHKELCDDEKQKKLIEEIDNSDISQKDKDFLKKAAARHCVFNYGKIADFYAHSDKKVQELMEKSALVIIDFKKAIENGYTKICEEIVDQYLEDYDE